MPILRITKRFMLPNGFLGRVWEPGLSPFWRQQLIVVSLEAHTKLHVACISSTLMRQDAKNMSVRIIMLVAVTGSLTLV